MTLKMCFTGNKINVTTRCTINYYYIHVRELPIQWYMYKKGKYVLPIRDNTHSTIIYA